MASGAGVGGVDLRGRVAVVTGASRGLGAGLAASFVAAGLRVGVCARSSPVLRSGPDVVARRVDVTDAPAVAAFAREVAAHLGPIDLWVNNAGVLEPIGPLRDADAGEVAHHLAVNVGGVVNGTLAYLRHRHEVGSGGVLVNVSSGAARHGYEGWGPYCAGKAAVDRLTEVVALEEARHGLRAYAVAPGVVDTDMQAAIRATPAERFPAVERFHALKRAGAFNTPGHVADHLLRLAFDPAARPDGWEVRVPDEA
jgi:benzil reductase ((S)-benzoin forming)